MKEREKGKKEMRERRKEKRSEREEENPSLKNDVHLRGSGRQMFFFVNVQIVLNFFPHVFLFHFLFKKKEEKKGRREGKERKEEKEMRKLFTATPPLDQESNP